MGERATDSPVVKFAMTSQLQTNIDLSLPTAGSAGRAGFSSGPSRFFCILAMFAVLASAEYLLMSWVALPRSSSSLDEGTGKKSFIFSIKGLETTKVTGDQKIRLKIGSVMVAPRKFLVFIIQPFNEALFEDFSVDYFRLPHNQSMFALDDIQQTLLPADGKGMLFSGFFNLKTGVITRGVIRRFTLTVYEDDDIKTVVKSAKAELDFKNNKIRLEDASIEQHDFKRIIKSSEAILKNFDGTVNIPGKYSILHPEGVLKGSGVKIRL
jgi:hypothetical protein